MVLSNQLLKLVRSRAKLLAVLLIGLVIGGVSSAAVMAAVPDTDGMIHACYSNSTGDARVIDSPSQSCSGGETAIAWQQGVGNGGFVSNMVGKDFSGASLQARDFANKDMHGSNFTGANLSGGDWQGVDLAGSDMGSAKMKSVNFTGAIFSNTSFNPGNIEMQDSNFTNANFSGATFDAQNYFLDGAQLQNANFSNATFGFNSVSTFNNAEMQTANLSSAKFKKKNRFLDSNFQGQDFTNSILESGTTLAGNFSNTNFSGMTLGISLQQSNVSGADFTNVQFDGADLTGSDMSSSTLTGASWNDTVCPDGSNSNDNSNTCSGHLVP